MKIIIRTANNQDIEGIINLIQEFYSAYNDKVNLQKYDSDLIDIEKNYFRVNGHFWIVENHKGRIIASMGLKNYTNNTAELKRVAVSYKYRRQGIATKLLATATEYAKKINCKKLFLWTDIRYKISHIFYEKAGFVYKETKVFNNADLPWTALLYEKTL